MPLPISQLSTIPLNAVFSDLDDTLTDSSFILPSTLQAIHDLSQAGFKVVIVSGRPAGWADSLMRLIPLDSVIFENGAGLMWRENNKILTQCLASGAPLKSPQNVLEELFSKIKREIPQAKLATDQSYRLFDYAIDFNEEPPFLTDAQVKRIMQLLNDDSRVTAKLSSIHINYWVGTHTKLTACEFWLKKFGQSTGITKETVVYSGDSPNDEPLFGFFPHSVGVANVKRFLPIMKQAPAYITSHEGGKGFQEIAQLLLKEKQK